MDTATTSRAYYDDFSDWYERERKRGYHAMLDELEVEAVRPYVKHVHTLEVGCGTGLVMERLAKVARSVQGVDLSPGMLARARARGLDVREGSATALPYPDESFDAVVSFKVLAHVPDLGGAVREMVRVTRPGGHVAIELYNPLSLRFLAKRLGGPGAVSRSRTEADVYTRWDLPDVALRVMPPGTELVETVGIRVLTPAAFVHRVPGVHHALALAEKLASRSPLRTFGGFHVSILRKK